MVNPDVNVPVEITEGTTTITIYVEKAEEPKPVEEKKGSLTVTVHDSDSKQDLAEYSYTSGEEKALFSSFKSEDWYDGDSLSSLRSSLLSSVEVGWELLLLGIVFSVFTVETDWLEDCFSFVVLNDLNDENSFVPQSSEQKSNDNYYDKNRAPHSLKGNNFTNNIFTL